MTETKAARRGCERFCRGTVLVGSRFRADTEKGPQRLDPVLKATRSFWESCECPESRAYQWFLRALLWSRFCIASARRLIWHHIMGHFLEVV